MPLRVAAALLLLASAVLAVAVSRHPPVSQSGAALPARGIAPSIATHPTWPQAWMAEVQRLAAADDFSARFDTALARVIQLGPSERQMRQTLALLALQHWARLSPEAQRLSADNLRFALHALPQQVLVKAFQLRHETLVCGLWSEGGTIAEVCERQRQLRSLCDRSNMNQELANFCLERGATPLHPPRS